MALKHEFVSEAPASSDLTKVDGPKWNAGHKVDEGGLPMALAASSPGTPAAGFMLLFAKTVAGGALPAYVGPSGLDSLLQPFFGRNKIGIWSCIGNSTAAVHALGINVPSNSGTVTMRNVATTNLFASTQRTGYVGAATAGSSAGPRLDKLQFWRGNAAGLGGFRVVMRYGCSDAATISDGRSFAGLVGITAALPSANPSTNTNIIGVGTDSGDSTLSIMHNDGAGTATKIALGADFPDHTLSTDLYEVAIFCAPNSGEVGVQVTRLNTGHVAVASITTDLPANTQLLAPQIWRNNGATALAPGVDLVGGYFEKDT